MYTPGKGSGAVASIVTGSGAGVVTATQLPQTGISLINELAIAVAAGLVVWAVAYKLTHKSA
jgi:hypothetical protein